jgi:hypothetical protein
MIWMSRTKIFMKTRKMKEMPYDTASLYYPVRTVKNDTK